MPSGKLEEPRVRSHLGPFIESIFRIRDGARAAVEPLPSFVIRGPRGGAVLWLDESREEYWQSYELMLLALGLQQSDLEIAQHHGLRSYSIVRPMEKGYGIVVAPYFSLPHAARMALEIGKAYGVFCGVLDQNHEFQGFDASIADGDVVRTTPRSTETFLASVTWNRVSLEPQRTFLSLRAFSLS